MEEKSGYKPHLVLFTPKHKFMFKKLILIIALLCAFKTQSQTVDTSITSYYSKSVVIRVHNVVSKIHVTIAEQQALADLFQDEENDINNLIVNNASPIIIDSVKANYKSAFNQLLSAQQIKDYYTITNTTKVNTTARLMALMQKRKYNTDATMQQYFKTIYGWREEAIEYIWNKNVDTPVRNNNLYKTMVSYDSLLGIYTNAANGGNYFTSRANYLDSIKPIDTTKRKQLSQAFYNNCIDYKYKAYADNFKTALNTVFNNIVDSPYYIALYGNSIASIASNSAIATLSSYIKRDNVSSSTASQILPILQQRERVVAIINHIYPSYTQTKDSITDTLTKPYQKQIDSLIAKDGSLHNNSQIDVALYYASQLNLTTTQISSLQTALTTLNGLKESFRATNEFAEYDSKAFESETLTGILTAEQHTQVLTTKYYNTAVNMAKQDWAALVNAQLTEGLTEVDTKTELTNYHLAVVIAYYRYAHNLETQYSSINSIKEMRPDALSILLNHWNYKNPYNDTPDTFFQW
jgi:hypothetical protein